MRAGAYPELPGALTFSFCSKRKFPAQRRAIPLEISLRSAKGHELGARNELIMGNDWRLEARNSGFSARPLPVIGVRRVIMQTRAHVHVHRTAPLQWRS